METSGRTRTKKAPHEDIGERSHLQAKESLHKRNQTNWTSSLQNCQEISSLCGFGNRLPPPSLWCLLQLPKEPNTLSMSSSLLLSFLLLLLSVSLSFLFLYGIFYPTPAPDEKNERAAALQGFPGGTGVKNQPAKFRRCRFDP